MTVDIAKMRASWLWLTERVGTHYDGCEYGHRWHEGCAIVRLCDEVDDVRAKLAAAIAALDTEAETLRRVDESMDQRDAAIARAEAAEKARDAAQISAAGWKDDLDETRDQRDAAFARVEQAEAKHERLLYASSLLNIEERRQRARADRLAEALRESLAAWRRSAGVGPSPEDEDIYDRARAALADSDAKGMTNG